MPTKQKSGEPRSRGWFLTRSYEYDRQQAAKQGYVLTEDEWRRNMLNMIRALRESQKFRFLHFIFHSKDPAEDANGNPIIHEDGSYDLKILHIHILAACISAQNRSWIVSQFGLSDREENAIRWSKKRDRTHWALYLTHSNQKDRTQGKYEYAISEVDAWFSDATTPEAAEAAFRKMRTGKMPEDKFVPTPARARFEYEHLTLIERGLETPEDVTQMLNDPEVIGELELEDSPRYRFELETSFSRAQEQFLYSLMDYYQHNHRCLTTVYLEARNGLGKTELATAIAWHEIEKTGSALGIHNVPASGGDSLTFDPAGTYKGQLVSIINEFSGSTIALPQFKDMFDPIHASLTNSRNTDKFYAASYALFTADEPIEEQFKEMFMAYGRATVHRGDYEATGRDGRMSESDWTELYKSKKGDQIPQAARRMAIYIRLFRVGDDLSTGHFQAVKSPFALGIKTIAVIYVRDDSHNKAELDYFGDSRAYTGIAGFPCFSHVLDVRGIEMYPQLVASVNQTVIPYGANPSRSVVNFWPADAITQSVNDSMDCGRYDFVCAIPVDPFDDDSKRNFCDAVDYAIGAYHALNGYTVTPDNTPALPDIKAWNAERVTKLKERRDARREAEKNSQQQ